jgi:hypothetical protein
MTTANTQPELALIGVRVCAVYLALGYRRIVAGPHSHLQRCIRLAVISLSHSMRDSARCDGL